MAIWIDWAILGSCFVLAIFIGLFVKKFKRTTIALLGAAGGVSIGFLVITATTLHNSVAYYLILIGAGLFGALISVYLQEWVIIISSAFFGSYIAVRGVSFYFGGFPSETSLVHFMKDGHITFKELDKIFYAYLGSIVGLFVLATIFQIWSRERIEDRDDKRRYTTIAKREAKMRAFNT